jgi:hypothetical protein
MIVESIDFTRELYFAILLDRAFNGPVMVVSPKGGMDIEAVAEETPDEIYKVCTTPRSLSLLLYLHTLTPPLASLGSNRYQQRPSTRSARVLGQEVELYRRWHPKGRHTNEANLRSVCAKRRHNG